MPETSSHTSTYDSSREQLGAVYAKGLLGAAEGQNVTDQVLVELDSLIDDVLDRVENFEQLLASPRVPLEEKVRMLDAAFAARMNPLLLNFLKVAARHGRLDCLRQIRTAAHRLYDELRGRVAVTVTTARTIDVGVRNQIQQRLTLALGRQVALTSEVDPELLGGLVVRIGDTVFDGSLDNRLEKMRSETLDRTTQLIRESLQRFLVSE